MFAVVLLAGSAAPAPAELYTVDDLPNLDGGRRARPGQFWMLYGPPLERPATVTGTVRVIVHPERAVGGQRFEGFVEVRVTVGPN